METSFSGELGMEAKSLGAERCTEQCDLNLEVKLRGSSESRQSFSVFDQQVCLASSPKAVL